MEFAIKIWKVSNFYTEVCSLQVGGSGYVIRLHSKQVMALLFNLAMQYKKSVRPIILHHITILIHSNGITNDSIYACSDNKNYFWADNYN